MKGGFIVGGIVGAGALLVLLSMHGRKNLAASQTDMQLGEHRGLMITKVGNGGLAIRMPSAQDPKPLADLKGYPYQGTRPSSYAQGRWVGRWMGPIGYTTLDYGQAPTRIPHLWKDGIRYWDGIEQRAFTQQNYRIVLFHLRPSIRGRGYRSISGALAPGGPTSSRVRIPAIFIPSGVA